MKKTLYFLLVAVICTAANLATPATSIAQQCINQVHENAREFQAGGTYLVQSGWGQTKETGALFNSQVRTGKLWNFFRNPFTDVLPYLSLLDTCATAGATHFTLVSDVPMLGVVQHRVTLTPVDTVQLYSGISTYIKLPWAQHASARMVQVDLADENEAGTEVQSIFESNGLTLDTTQVTGVSDLTDLNVSHDDFMSNRTIKGDAEDKDYGYILDQIFPIAGNPGSNITIQNPYEVPFTVEVTDLMGKVITTSYQNGGTFSLSSDISGAGVYFFKITIDTVEDGGFVRKAIIQ
ncbi:MAG: T9SS type A sorting domain-containing protein [Candidatus Pacebacteria bacterium]|nr:T9SS type A sorting domain-containing protein [Candidatus Paceibacterota bacterium]